MPGIEEDTGIEISEDELKLIHIVPVEREDHMSIKHHRQFELLIYHEYSSTVSTTRDLNIRTRIKHEMLKAKLIC
jgi:hypothetical protein